MALGAKEGCLPLGSWGKLLGGGDTQGLENVKDSLGELWAEKAAWVRHRSGKEPCSSTWERDEADKVRRTRSWRSGLFATPRGMWCEFPFSALSAIISP